MPKITIENMTILCEPDEKYIQVDDIKEADTQKVWQQITAQYPGFTVDFVFHNTVAPINFLNEIGAKVIDDCIEARLVKKDLIQMPARSTTRIDDSNFDAFAALHDEKNIELEMYWTSERLRQNLANWDIFGIFDGDKLTGYSFLRSGWEIYCAEADSLEDKLALISACVYRAFEKNPDVEVLYMIDRNAHLELGAAMHLGFRRVGYYISYRTTT